MTNRQIQIEWDRSAPFALGRHVNHDEQSKAFAVAATVDRSTWRDKAIRIYDPLPNPNQCHGECTGCAKSMQMNAVGNRVKGVVLKMDDAHKLYHLATTLDPWEGTWQPDDTGSSGLAAAKAAQQLGLGGEYRWLFNLADGVVQAIMNGHVVNCGTNWYYDMFNQNSSGLVVPGGGIAGGHEWSARGYDLSSDRVLGRCWWGTFRDFWIKRTDLADLLADNGDAHIQARS